MMTNYNVPYYPNRPDNAERGKHNAEKISNTLKTYHANPNNEERLKQAQEKRHASMDWEEHRKHNAHINSDPKIIAKRRANHKKWQESEEGKSAYLKGRKKICKTIQDPNGKIWPSRKDAAEAWDIRPQAISKYVKTPNSGWDYL